MNLTANACAKAGEYGISATEITAVVTGPERTRPGSKANTVLLSRVVDGRTIVVVADEQRTVAITCFVPDDEWRDARRPERQLTAHGRERMEALGLTTADIDYVIENADHRDYDDKGNSRSHRVYDGRYLIVVTDPTRRDVITVYTKDSIWSALPNRKAIAATDTTFNAIIGDLRRQLQDALAVGKAEKERADSLQEQLRVVHSRLNHPPLEDWRETRQPAA